MSQRWAAIVKNVFGEDTHIVFPRFFNSKKNQVTLLEMDKGGVPFRAVAKYCVWGDSHWEWEILNMMYRAGIKVPRPISKYENIIFTEYIAGDNFHSLINMNQSVDVKSLGRWFALLHKSFQRKDGKTLIKGDGMLPNFIIHEDTGEIYGVDFEESLWAEPERDLADVTATLILATQEKEGKMDMAFSFLEGYRGEHPIPLQNEYLKEEILANLKKRIRFSPHRRDEIEKWISKIKSMKKIVG